MAASTMADVIIVGGGIAGTVIASRLQERKPSLSIVVIEAGADPAGNLTTPQEHLDGNPKRNVGFKGLGGGSVINTGKHGSCKPQAVG